MVQILNLRDLQMIERVHARGGRFRYYPLLAGQEGAPGNFFLQLSNTFDDFASPRHRHNFDQVRIQLQGDADFARDGVMRPGTIGYFPEGVFYGPQTIAGESLTLVLQFGGASGSGYLSEAAFQRGIAELKQKGRFEGGIYKVDKPEGGTRNQDAYEAVWEHVNGRRLRYPEGEGAQAPAFLQPEDFPWQPSPGEPGVERRLLGRFSSAQTALSVLRLAAGASASLSPNAVLFVMKGSGDVTTGEDKPPQGDWERYSSIYTGDSAVRLVAWTESEVVQVRLPQL
ncbi:hypothetical protein [Pseudacidovorax intermedius]|uniref:Quercetin 2,3-dioxygenase n=1 Tax=Pseudacidovorax intermedius TaxID=433924 RepID=A0A370FDL2_9BURK|nr:hypothetical protein [Pseudacidovorax intermedius]RDI22810.1 hypothetical protein DFR41_107213 [Pseudacidovorax intermedius]